jgi:preprotein translocase subunit SecD
MMWRLGTIAVGIVSLTLATPACARSFSIGGIAFSEAEILDARAQPDLTGMAGVLISFDAAGAQKIAQLTNSGVGKPLPIILDGIILAEPVLRDPITDGQVMISGSFGVKDAERLAKQISGKEPLPDALDEETP